jgi:hypothetical protein
MVGSSDYSCRHDAEPKAALEALVHHDGPLLLDLDETAYLRDSTESGRPRRRRVSMLKMKTSRSADVDRAGRTEHRTRYLPLSGRFCEQG